MESEGEKEDKEKEGGLINHIYYLQLGLSIFNPQSEGINNLISNIFHHIESRVGEEEKKHHEQEQTADTGGGGGIIDNIVSHLPTPLAGMYILPFSCLISHLLNFLYLTDLGIN